MIELVETGGMYSDATCSYDGIIHKATTIEQFIENVLKDNKEWGSIYIGRSLSREKVCEYRYGKILFLNRNINKNKYIKSFSAHGGWSNMDYFLEV